MKKKLLLCALISTLAFGKVSDREIKSLTTPDRVETSIGVLNFEDGAPTKDTAEKLYYQMDLMNATQSFLRGMKGASMHSMLDGMESLGVDENNEAILFENLMDSNSIFLTANTSTMYLMSNISLEDGPVVLEVPEGLLGAINNAWFEHKVDIGPLGPYKGKAGKYIILPPNYDGEVPSGYAVVRSNTNRLWTFLRGNVSKGLEVEAKRIKENYKVYNYRDIDSQKEMVFVNGSGVEFNTIHPTDGSYFTHLNDLIQQESIDIVGPELKGLFSSIGIEKGREFNPDERMLEIYDEAARIGMGMARSIVWYPRQEEAKVYEGSNSNWMRGYVDNDVFFTTKSGGKDTDAETMFFTSYTGISPAMAIKIPGKGSDYGIAYLDSDDEIFRGDETYKIHLPKDVPVENFWAVTLYDTQTRSMLKTSQKFPTVDSNGEIKGNKDGSYDIYIGPEAPKGKEDNWLETNPDKSFFVILRMYSPKREWIEKEWKPSEVEKLR